MVPAKPAWVTNSGGSIRAELQTEVQDAAPETTAFRIGCWSVSASSSPIAAGMAWPGSEDA